ncbi:MAG TPA: glutamate synthase, partial [Euryarchaeota archaeon]|nr:glutamate synthase [Euryarchaeota archaeon]
MSKLSSSIGCITSSRRGLPGSIVHSRIDDAAEGGCGVVGLVSTVQVEGRHILKPMIQMHNRGNGKGGGVAAVGLDPMQMGVSEELLNTDYLIQVAYLNPEARTQVEEKYIDSQMIVHHRSRIGPKHGTTKGEQGVYHPEVWRYFCRAKPDVLDRFVTDNGLEEVDAAKAEDEFVYQNSYRLNNEFYASLGDKKAFVLSHGKNLMVFKIVGYAEEAMHYYGLENLRAHV